MESNLYTRWSNSLSRCSRCPNDRNDELDKCQPKSVDRLNRRSQNTTGRCIGSWNNDQVQKNPVAPLEPTLQEWRRRCNEKMTWRSSREIRGTGYTDGAKEGVSASVLWLLSTHILVPEVFPSKVFILVKPTVVSISVQWSQQRMAVGV
jgi:hypothetical protein